ncbi:MAG: hypothetical protein ACFCBW_11720 [Candidatus Competibacterales bacterium]
MRIDWGLGLIATTGTTCAAWVWFNQGPGAFWQILMGDAHLLLAVLPKVIAGVLLAGLLAVLLPREQVAAWLGQGSGVYGLILSAAVGALLPGGPAMVFPLGVTLIARGADGGAVTAYLLGWALLSLNRTLVWEVSFMGFELAALRWGICLPLPVVVGALVRRLGIAPRP